MRILCWAPSCPTELPNPDPKAAVAAHGVLLATGFDGVLDAFVPGREPAIRATVIDEVPRTVGPGEVRRLRFPGGQRTEDIQDGTGALTPLSQVASHGAVGRVL